MSGIPIPSFGVPPSTEPGRGTASFQTQKGQRRSSRKSSSSLSVVTPATTLTMATATNSRSIPARWNATSLMVLEVSLQHWFRKQSKSSMTLDDFYALVRKLDWSQTKAPTKLLVADDAMEAMDETKAASKARTRTNASNAIRSRSSRSGILHKNAAPHPHDTQVRGLTLDERLLHDLLCATADPALAQPLYRIVDTSNSYLESIAHTSEQMRRALSSATPSSSSSTTTFDKIWSNKIRTMILAHRDAKEKELAAKKKSKENATVLAQEKKKTKLAMAAAPPRAIITEGMTVDERVHARAKAKQQHEDFLIQEQQSSSHKSGDPSNAQRKTDVDRTWMLQLADALWTHARSILQRQNYRLPGKLASNSLLHPQRRQANNNNNTRRTNNTPSAKNNRCVMTFADVIQTIAKSRLGEASPIQIAKALTELEGYSPKWIVVMRDATANETKHNNKKKGTNHKQSFKWSRASTTIFIHPDHYPAVRSQLTGVALPPNSCKIEITNNNGNAKATQLHSKNEEQPSRKRSSPVLSKNLLQEFDITESKRAKTKDANAPSSPTISASKTATMLMAGGPPSTPVTKKRAREDSSATATTAVALPKSNSPAGGGSSPNRKKRLRINPNLILNDADYTGGEVLPASVLDAASPRGLKRLFLQLNAGKRI